MLDALSNLDWNPLIDAVAIGLQGAIGTAAGFVPVAFIVGKFFLKDWLQRQKNEKLRAAAASAAGTIIRELGAGIRDVDQDKYLRTVGQRADELAATFEDTLKRADGTIQDLEKMIDGEFGKLIAGNVEPVTNVTVVPPKEIQHENG